MKQSMLLLNQLLKDKEAFIQRSLQGRLKSLELTTLATLGGLFFMIYGGIIGISHSGAQAIASALKLPCLFIITSAICFPTLYFFLTVLGARQDVRQLFSFVIICLTIMSVVLMSFAPVSLFFLISTQSYAFFKLLNVAIFAVAGFVGLYFFYKNILQELDQIGDYTNKRRAKLFLRLWLLLFAFIGSQLSYNLSPFFGDPQIGFILFTEGRSNFYLDILASLARIH